MQVGCMSGNGAGARKHANYLVYHLKSDMTCISVGSVMAQLQVFWRDQIQLAWFRLKDIQRYHGMSGVHTVDKYSDS
jgi:hypothetical protein